MSRDESSTSSPRRGLLGAVLASGTLVAGCGFRPLYAPVTATDGSVSDIRDELAAVRVGPLLERNGQLLRRSLQRRLEGSQPGTPARYLLTVGIDIGAEGIGYQRDGTITRLRYSVTGSWSLSTLGVPPERIAASAIPYRELDSFNVPDLQFFSADSSRDAATVRLMEVLSEEIVRQVALQLRHRRETRDG